MAVPCIPVIAVIRCTTPASLNNTHVQSYTGNTMDDVVFYECDGDGTVLGAESTTTFNISCVLQEDLVTANWSTPEVCVGKTK